MCNRCVMIVGTYICFSKAFELLARTKQVPAYYSLLIEH